MADQVVAFPMVLGKGDAATSIVTRSIPGPKAYSLVDVSAPVNEMIMRPLPPHPMIICHNNLVSLHPKTPTAHMSSDNIEDVFAQCPTCGAYEDGRPSCCAFGGAWHGKCDDGDGMEHTWSEGFWSCRCKYSRSCRNHHDIQLLPGTSTLVSLHLVCPNS